MWHRILEISPLWLLGEIFSAGEGSVWELGEKRVLHLPHLTLLQTYGSAGKAALSPCPHFTPVLLTGRSLRRCFPWPFPHPSRKLRAKSTCPTPCRASEPVPRHFSGSCAPGDSLVSLSLALLLLASYLPGGKAALYLPLCFTSVTPAPLSF